MMIFAELQMQGNKHVEVNGGLLRSLKLIYPTENLLIVSDSKHYKNLINSLADSNNILPWRTFKYNNREDSKKNTFSKTIRQVLLAYQIFNKAKKERTNLIVFTSVFPFVAPFLNRFANIFKQKIIVCQHGDLGVLLLKKDRLATRIFRVAIIKFLQNRDTRYNTFLFYGESIKENLFSIFPNFPSSNVIAIDHPYNYNQLNNKPINAKTLLRIANIGSALKSKNSQLFFELAEKFKFSIADKKIEFVQIGNISPEIIPYVNTCVLILAADNDFVPFDEFEEALCNADYFIYFFEKNSYYDLCPSGTFFDAVKNQKPIISLRNSFFEFYFKKLGNIGYLCDSIDEMEILINEIIAGKKLNEYEYQVDNLKIAHDVLSVENIASNLKRQITFLGI